MPSGNLQRSHDRQYRQGTGAPARHRSRPPHHRLWRHRPVGQLAYVASGCIRTDEKLALPERLGIIVRGIAEIVATYAPAQAAIEEVFLNKNPGRRCCWGSARRRDRCAGRCRPAGRRSMARCRSKQSVVGHGRATKEQVQHMVRRLLALSGEPSPDAADALACAIAHAHGGQGLGALSSAGRRKSGRLTSIASLNNLNVKPK